MHTYTYTSYILLTIRTEKGEGSGLPRLKIVTTLCGPLHLMLTVTLGDPWVRLLSLRARHAFASAVVEAARGQGGPARILCGKSGSLQAYSILQQFFDIFGKNANKMSIALCGSDFWILRHTQHIVVCFYFEQKIKDTIHFDITC